MKKRHTLLLLGVFVSNCDIKVKHIIDEVKLTSEITVPEVVYDKIPKKITDINSWPTSLFVKCWTCGDLCTNKFCSIALEFNNRSGSIEINIKGAFDSWNCAAYHIQYFMENNDNYKLYLRRLAKMIDKVEYYEIPISIHPWTKTEYGGTICNRDYKILNNFAIIKHNECCKLNAPAYIIPEETVTNTDEDILTLNNEGQ